MTWNDAHAFCKWLSESEGLQYGLPTEAQWEFACRAGTTGATYAGTGESLADIAWTMEQLFPGVNENHRPQRVGLKRPNPFGLYHVDGTTILAITATLRINPHDK